MVSVFAIAKTIILYAAVCFGSLMYMDRNIILNHNLITTIPQLGPAIDTTNVQRHNKSSWSQRTKGCSVIMNNTIHALCGSHTGSRETTIFEYVSGIVYVIHSYICEHM